VKILIAEDDRVSRRVLEMFLLKWGYEVVLATDGIQAWEVLQSSDAPRLALLDWMMPGKDGIQLCREIRKRDGQPYVYVVLLTAKGQKQDLLEGLEAGADDYVVKPFDAAELRARLRAGERILELQSQLMAAGEALRFQANHDPLTGLYNRAAILDLLHRELPRSHREGRSLGIVLLDLDNFKHINDTRGHLAGDAVLREVARRMSAGIRAYDAVGRYGGEEFLIVVPSSDAMGTLGQAERIRASLVDRPVEAPEGEILVTASMGVVSTDIVAAADTDALLRAADAALYRAKSGGRNRAELAAAVDEAAESLQSPSEASPTRSKTR
jgi:two-component system cell cycle response regulator